MSIKLKQFISESKLAPAPNVVINTGGEGIGKALSGLGAAISGAGDVFGKIALQDKQDADNNLASSLSSEFNTRLIKEQTDMKQKYQTDPRDPDKFKADYESLPKRVMEYVLDANKVESGTNVYDHLIRHSDTRKPTSVAESLGFVEEVNWNKGMSNVKLAINSTSDVLSQIKPDIPASQDSVNLSMADRGILKPEPNANIQQYAEGLRQFKELYGKTLEHYATRLPVESANLEAINAVSQVASSAITERLNKNDIQSAYSVLRASKEVVPASLYATLEERVDSAQKTSIVNSVSMEMANGKNTLNDAIEKIQKIGLNMDEYKIKAAESFAKYDNVRNAALDSVAAQNADNIISMYTKNNKPVYQGVLDTIGATSLDVSNKDHMRTFNATLTALAKAGDMVGSANLKGAFTASGVYKSLAEGDKEIEGELQTFINDPSEVTYKRLSQVGTDKPNYSRKMYALETLTTLFESAHTPESKAIQRYKEKEVAAKISQSYFTAYDMVAKGIDRDETLESLTQKYPLVSPKELSNQVDKAYQTFGNIKSAGKELKSYIHPDNRNKVNSWIKDTVTRNLTGKRYADAQLNPKDPGRKQVDAFINNITYLVENELESLNRIQEEATTMVDGKPLKGYLPMPTGEQVREMTKRVYQKYVGDEYAAILNNNRMLDPANIEKTMAIATMEIDELNSMAATVTPKSIEGTMTAYRLSVAKALNLTVSKDDDIHRTFIKKDLSEDEIALFMDYVVFANEVPNHILNERRLKAVKTAEVDKLKERMQDKWDEGYTERTLKTNPANRYSKFFSDIRERSSERKEAIEDTRRQINKELSGSTWDKASKLPKKGTDEMFYYRLNNENKGAK